MGAAFQDFAIVPILAFLRPSFVTLALISRKFPSSRRAWAATFLETKSGGEDLLRGRTFVNHPLPGSCKASALALNEQTYKQEKFQ